MTFLNWYPANSHLFKVNNRNTRKGGEYVTPFSSVSIGDFEQVNINWDLPFCNKRKKSKKSEVDSPSWL